MQKKHVTITAIDDEKTIKVKYEELKPNLTWELPDNTCILCTIGNTHLSHSILP